MKDIDSDIDLAIHDKLSRCTEGKFIKIINLFILVIFLFSNEVNIDLIIKLFKLRV